MVESDGLSGNPLRWLFEPLPWLALSVGAYLVGWYLVCGLLFFVFLFTGMAKVGGRRG